MNKIEKSLLHITLLFLLVFSCSSNIDKEVPTTTPEPEIYLPSLSETIEYVSPSVVAINISTVALDRFFIPRIRSADGSGVIISEDGYIVTNDHVIKDAREISVILNDESVYQGKIIGRVPYSDIALIKIDTEQELVPIEFSSSKELKVGDWVIALGNAFGLAGTPTVTAGIVSAKERVIETEDDRTLTDMIQTDAAINEGNSGGPLVNLSGKLVGLNSTIMRGAEGIGFAISSDLVLRYINDLLEFGEVQIPRDGIEGRTLDPNFINTLCEVGYNLCELDENFKGVAILEIATDSPAVKSGLLPGDIIISIENKPVRSYGEYISWTYNFRPGDTIRLNIIRGQEEIEVSLVLDKN
ncbi:MAG: trypsin-like peptidase domain-containing protein [Chloroflexota bacterium]|nr:trypsin-like peptidase domain-containing protein [Chloroflexota bacterium]